eukprot:gene16137-biopygen2222
MRCGKTCWTTARPAICNSDRPAPGETRLRGIPRTLWDLWEKRLGTRPFLQNLSCGTRPGRVRDAMSVGEPSSIFDRSVRSHSSRRSRQGPSEWGYGSDVLVAIRCRRIHMSEEPRKLEMPRRQEQEIFATNLCPVFVRNFPFDRRVLFNIRRSLSRGLRQLSIPPPLYCATGQSALPLPSAVQGAR